jgi:hypothetical protein
MQIIKLEQKQVYGNTVYYPANEAGVIFAKIANTKTLLPATLKLAKELGYTIELTTPTLDIV